MTIRYLPLNIGTGAIVLSGNSVTTSQGTPVASISLALGGNSATASAGSVAVQVAIVPQDNQVNTSAGSPTASISLALGGQSVTTSAGVSVASIALGVSGQSITSSQGTPVAALSLGLGGCNVTTSAGSVAVQTPPITLALTGSGVTTSVGTLVPIVPAPNPVVMVYNQNNLGAKVVSRPISWLDLSMRAWGSEWASPDTRVYQFSNGRSFDSTDKGDTGFYGGGAV